MGCSVELCASVALAVCADGVGWCVCSVLYVSFSSHLLCCCSVFMPCWPVCHGEAMFVLCALTALQEVGTKKLLKICALIVETRNFNG